MMARYLPLAVLVLSFAPVDSGGAGPPQPNIVFILIDDLRWDDLGCAGHPFARTPNIDRIAREGAQFRNAFATTPLCSPSRGSILTGQYAHTHGIIDNTERSEQSHRLKTFPQELQKGSYETIFIGKWHMGNDNSPRPGFDRWFCLKGQGSSFDPVVNDDGSDVEARGYVTDVLNERSVKLIRRRRSRPFFLYLSHKAIHPEVYQGPDGSLSDPTASNFIPAPRHQNLYEGVSIARRPNAGVPPLDKPALQQKIAGLPSLGPQTGSSDTVVLNRLRMLASVDEGVGAILQALSDAGQLDNTLIVVTSDHGYFYGEHGLSVERRLAYEESIRVPLLMRWPGVIAAGSSPKSFALLVDLAPTFVEVAGGAIASQYQGRSLMPLLKGDVPADWRSTVLIEYYSDTVFPRMNKMAYKAVRSERWKYIHYAEQTDADELYDLHNDPYELRNLAADPAAAAPLARMQNELQKLLAETSAD